MPNQEFYTFREYMKNDNELLSPSAEDYLEMIYRLSENQGFTRVSDIAAALNVQPPSVTKMIKKLSDMKLIKYEKYGMIILEDKGIKKGIELLQRHNLIENFLTLMNVSNKRLEETEKIEHTINEETLCGMKDLLDFFRENPSIQTQFHNYRDKKKVK